MLIIVILLLDNYVYLNLILIDNLIAKLKKEIYFSFKISIMLVNYDSSSDEESIPSNPNSKIINDNTTKTLKNSSNSSMNVMTNNSNLEAKKVILNPSNLKFKSSKLLLKLPDVSSLLSSIREGGHDDDDSTQIRRPLKLETEDYRNVPPPEYSLTREGEWMDQYNEKHGKRKLPRQYQKDDQYPSMDKYIKLNSNITNQLNEESSIKKNDKIIEEPTGKQPQRIKSDGNRLIPTQARIKRSNIPTESN